MYSHVQTTDCEKMLRDLRKSTVYSFPERGFADDSLSLCSQ